MPAAALPPNEPERLAALHALRLLDTPADAVFDSLIRLARSILGTPIAAISLVDRDRQWFKSIAGLPGLAQTPRDHSFCAHAILRPDELLTVIDAQTDPRFADNPLVTGEPRIRFYAGAPIFDGEGHALGALCVIDREPRRADPAVLEQLRDLATCATAAIRLHAAGLQLAAAAHCDPLTGLGNRRAFSADLDAAGSVAGMALLVIDLDGFKRINDLWGHAAGDAALVEAARRIRRVLRPEDRAYRLGGDEFAVLMMTGLSAHELRPVAERLHTEFASPFDACGQILTLRGSVGIATAETAATGHDLVAQADAALYEAKRAGSGLTRVAERRALKGDILRLEHYVFLRPPADREIVSAA